MAREDRLDLLVEALRAEPGARALVFVRTKRGADRLVKRLKARGVDALAMHGDKSQSQRERALSAFARGNVEAYSLNSAPVLSTTSFTAAAPSFRER